MKIVTICPRTNQALYVSNVKPSLLQPKAKGDWGYSPNYQHAIDLTERQTRIALADMTLAGRNPKVY